MPTRYYKRHRPLPICRPDGTLTEPVSALTTRYYSGLKRRKPHNVYWHDGVFYEHKNVPTAFNAGEPVAWAHALVPVADKTVTDRFLSQTVEQGKAAPVTLHITAGKVARATGAKGTDYEGVTLLDGTEPDGYVAALLDLS